MVNGLACPPCVQGQGCRQGPSDIPCVWCCQEQQGVRGVPHPQLQHQHQQAGRGVQQQQTCRPYRVCHGTACSNWQGRHTLEVGRLRRFQLQSHAHAGQPSSCPRGPGIAAHSCKCQCWQPVAQICGSELPVMLAASSGVPFMVPFLWMKLGVWHIVAHGCRQNLPLQPHVLF